MEGMRNFSVKIVGFRKIISAVAVSLLITLAGCATRAHYYSETKSEASKVYDKAQSLYNHKLFDDAKEYFQQIITNYPENPLVEVAMYYLGSCYKEKKEYQKAISIYQKLIDKCHYGFWVDLAEKDIEEIKSIQKR